MTSPWARGDAATASLVERLRDRLVGLMEAENLDYSTGTAALLAIIGGAIAGLATSEDGFRKGVEVHCEQLRISAEQA